MESHQASDRFVRLFARKLCQFQRRLQLDKDPSHAVFHYPVMDPEVDSRTFGKLWGLLTETLETENIHCEMNKITSALLNALANGERKASIRDLQDVSIAKIIFLSYGFHVDDTDDDMIKVQWV